MNKNLFPLGKKLIWCTTSYPGSFHCAPRWRKEELQRAAWWKEPGYEVVGYIQVYFTDKAQETINLASNNLPINIYTNLIWVNKEWNKMIWSPGFFRLRVIRAAPHYINWTSSWLRSWLKGGIENRDTSVKDTI